jgi:hypothetical protein
MIRFIRDLWSKRTSNTFTAWWAEVSAPVFDMPARAATTAVIEAVEAPVVTDTYVTETFIAIVEHEGATAEWAEVLAEMPAGVLDRDPQEDLVYGCQTQQAWEDEQWAGLFAQLDDTLETERQRINHELCTQAETRVFWTRKRIQALDIMWQREEEMAVARHDATVLDVLHNTGALVTV